MQRKDGLLKHLQARVFFPVLVQNQEQLLRPAQCKDWDQTTPASQDNVLHGPGEVLFSLRPADNGSRFHYKRDEKVVKTDLAGTEVVPKVDSQINTSGGPPGGISARGRCLTDSGGLINIHYDPH